MLIWTGAGEEREEIHRLGLSFDSVRSVASTEVEMEEGVVGSLLYSSERRVWNASIAGFFCAKDMETG